MKYFVSLIVSIFVLLNGLGQGKVADDEWSKMDRQSIRFSKGFVSKKETAISIARAVLLEKGLVSPNEKLGAKKYDGFWLVYLEQGNPGNEPLIGGILEVEVEQHSGAILRIESTK